MNNIVIRSLSGAVLIILVLGSILIHSWAMVLCFGVFTVLALIEFYNFFQNTETVSVSKPAGILVGTIIFSVFAFMLLDRIPITLILMLIFLSLFSLFLSEIWRKKPNPLFNLGVYTSSYIYIILPFLIMILIAVGYSKILLATMFILIWTNDTFAYLSGRLFGKTKLFPRISPNKTREGSIGGAILTVLVALTISYFVDQEYVLWTGAALVISISSILGDLLESLFKRSVNVKDSGNIMPGHGGILDRFDASLIAAPFFYCWLVIYSYF